MSTQVKPTPGPWEARDEYAGGTAARWSVGRAETGPEHTLARVLAPNGRPHGTAEANAHVMAAAPDMLEALKLVEGRFGAHTIDPLPIDLCQIVEAVIAKAEAPLPTPPPETPD